MNLSFENKVVLVTGAASGLGLATAKAFAESGASVVLADWNEKDAQSAAQELANKGHKTLAVRCDVSNDAQVEAMVKQTVATFGRLDAAYNNAGVQNVLAETADTAREDYDRVMGINLQGVWSCMKFELQQMRKQGSGTIVNCSSLGGLVGGAERGIYHAAKHGVIGFTKSAALEYAARGIRINAVCPGLIWTPMADQMVATGQGDITVIGRKSGRTISNPVGFVSDGDRLYLLPVQGSDTQWYKNVLKNPSLQIVAGGTEAEFKVIPVTDAKQVSSVVDRFRDKYGASDVRKYYSSFDVAVLAQSGEGAFQPQIRTA